MKNIVTEKPMITEIQNQDQIDVDVAMMKANLETAKSSGDSARVAKLEKQIALLEDAAAIYKLGSNEHKIFRVDIGDMPVSKAKQLVEKIKKDLTE